MELPSEEITRYARHLSLPEVGLDGQLKLKQASVLCIGAGGLGSPLAMYLAAAGVGRLGLVDLDVVDLSNLQRQIMHGQQDIGRPKVDSARETLTGINPHVDLEMHAHPLTRDNAMGLLHGYDVIVDGTDNFATRYLTNDACFFLKKPNVYGSIFRFEGQLSVFAPHLGGPCYRKTVSRTAPSWDGSQLCRRRRFRGFCQESLAACRPPKSSSFCWGRGLR